MVRIDLQKVPTYLRCLMFYDKPILTFYKHIFIFSLVACRIGKQSEVEEKACLVAEREKRPN